MLTTVLYFLAVLLVLFFLIGSVIYLITAIISALYNIPYVGSSTKYIKEALTYVQNEVKPQFLTQKDTKKRPHFFDLGSGDGRAVIIADKQFGYSAIGIERNPFLVIASKALSRIFKAQHSSFIRQNMLDNSLKNANVVYVFLLPKLLHQIVENIEKQCSKDTIVISHGFEIKPWKKHLIKTFKHKSFDTYVYKR